MRLPVLGAVLPASFAPAAASFLTPARGFVLGGIGWVCETYAETYTNYRYNSGIILNQSVITYTIGVPNASSLSVTRAR